MSINTFWKIILKSIGLWLLVSSFYILFQLLSTLSIAKIGWSDLSVVWIGVAALLITYILVIRVLLFKTSWLVTKLKLDKHFTEERIELNIGKLQLLSIVVILMGGFIFVDSFPLLVQYLLQFIQQKMAFKDYPEISWMMYAFIKTIAGYLIMTNSNFIVRLIDKKSTNTTTDEK